MKLNPTSEKIQEAFDGEFEKLMSYDRLIYYQSDDKTNLIMFFENAKISTLKNVNALEISLKKADVLSITFYLSECLGNDNDFLLSFINLPYLRPVIKQSLYDNKQRYALLYESIQISSTSDVLNTIWRLLSLISDKTYMKNVKEVLERF